MQLLPYSIETFLFGEQKVELVVPDNNELKNRFQQNTNQPFPYWAKVWEASVALSEFICEHEAVFKNKSVVELGACLGLASLVASKFAKHIVCSDYAEEALQYINLSIQQNQFTNISTQLIDWNFFGDAEIEEDIILMSDVNYHPENFNSLFNCFQKIIHQNKTIILATPQRITAKPFIEKLSPFIKQQFAKNIQQTSISIFIL
jgi:predicted nicotinamide N-methyase